jgi:hypothetical protein
MQNIIKLQVNKSKSKTNYIPSIPLNKKKNSQNTQTEHGHMTEKQTKYTSQHNTKTRTNARTETRKT